MGEAATGRGLGGPTPPAGKRRPPWAARPVDAGFPRIWRGKRAVSTPCGHACGSGWRRGQADGVQSEAEALKAMKLNF